MTRARKVIAAFAVAALLPLAPVAGEVANAAAPATDCVKSIPITSVDSITPDGVETKLTAGMATLYHYGTGNPGDDLREVVPPAGWSPATATTQELRTYGWPPRPATTNSQALAKWNADAAAWHPAASGPPQLCEGSLVSHVGAHAAASDTVGPDTVVSSSNNISWAGGEALKGSANIWTTDNKWTQPAFTSNACTSESRGSDAAYAVWGGIGGDNTQNLIQAGVETSAADGLVNRPFFNYLNASNATTHGDVKWVDVSAAGGDDLESWVYYQSTDNTAHFNVIDHTRSWSKSIYIGSGSSYWDPSTADFITEAPMKGSLPVPLLKPNAAGQTLLYSMTANGTGIANFNSERVTQQQGGLVIQATNFDGAHPWYDTWRDCFN